MLLITWRLASVDYSRNAPRVESSEVGCQETPEHNSHKNKTAAAEQDGHRHPRHIHQDAVDGVEAGHSPLGVPRVGTHDPPAETIRGEGLDHALAEGHKGGRRGAHGGGS